MDGPARNLSDSQLVESDLAGLPPLTRQFVERIHAFGLDRTRIHGLFVMLGLTTAAPTTREDWDALTATMKHVLPIDWSRNIDESVGHLYEGYQSEIGEFCFRSGGKFKFRDIGFPLVKRGIHIVRLQDHGLLGVDILAVERLAQSCRLYDAFIGAIGRATADQNASLMEAFQCGAFQISLHSRIDIEGARQIAHVIDAAAPLTLRKYLLTLRGNTVEYFLGLQPGQVALLELMAPMQLDYARQMWGFQSGLFYRDQKPLDGTDALGVEDWHAWVLQVAEEFNQEYPSELIPFARAGIHRPNLPAWPRAIAEFHRCDDYIAQAWGYRAVSLKNQLEIREYKALIVLLVYASLTSARDTVH